MSNIEKKEQRFIFNLLDFWTELKGELIYPNLSDLDLTQMHFFWDYAFILQIPVSRNDWHFTHIGDKLKIQNFKNSYYYNIKEISMDHFLHECIAHAPIIKEKGAPYSFGGQLISEEATILYRSILLPFSKNNKQVTAILGGINYLNLDTQTQSLNIKYNQKRVSS